MPAIASSGASYGWRARFGLLQPTLVSDNNPFEFYLMAPPGVQLVLTSLGIWDGPREQEYARAIAGIETPIRRLLSRDVDVIIQAGVPPIVSRGWGFEDELRARVAEWTDVPFATDIGCCISALQALGVSRPALLASEALQQGLPEYLAEAGIEVAAAASVSVDHEGAQHSLPLSLPYRAGIGLRQSAPDCDGMLILGAFMPTVGMIHDLEAATGVPVVSSAQSMMWQGLCLARVPAREVLGFGRLFQAS
jgi:maleate cis-trans isomerase